MILEVAGYLFIGFLGSIFAFNALSYTRIGEFIEKYSFLVWIYAIIFTIFWPIILLIWGLCDLLFNKKKNRE